MLTEEFRMDMYLTNYNKMDSYIVGLWVELSYGGTSYGIYKNKREYYSIYFVSPSCCEFLNY